MDINQYGDIVQLFRNSQMWQSCRDREILYIKVNKKDMMYIKVNKNYMIGE